MQQSASQETNSTTNHQELPSSDKTNLGTVEQESPEEKSNFCTLYRRGYCPFSSKDCKLAHRVSDLRFKKIDMNIRDDNRKEEPKVQSKPKEKKAEEERNEEQGGDNDNNDNNENNEERENNDTVRSPMVHLYEYQFLLRDKGEINHVHTLDEVNSVKEIRYFIRDKMYRDLQREFLDLLYKEYDTKALNKKFLQKCFLSVDWKPHWRYIVCPEYAFEVKLPNKGVMIVKQPQGEAFDTLMEEIVIRIIKDQQLLSKAPVNPSLFQKMYHQYLTAIDPCLPHLNLYLKYREFQSLEDYLDKLQNTESFVEKVAAACGKNVEEITMVPIFDRANNELQKLLAKMRKIVNNIMEESHIGFILYSRYEERVMKECSEILKQFSANMPKIKKLMMRTPLQENVLIINLGSTTYLFSLDKFKKADLERIRDKYYKKLYGGCTLPVSDHITLHQLPEIKPEPTTTDTISNRQTEEFLEKEIDLKKVVVVDDEESLIEAIEHLSKVDAVGVDLEGNLSKDGGIELLQCASRSKIFIFDVYKIKKMAKEDEKNIELYKKMSRFLKNLVEDSKICKIFHDGRKDSLALHVFLDACPSNVFDLSATYMLIEHLKIYKSQKSQLDKDNFEETKVNADKEETKLDEKQKESLKKKKEARSEATWNLIGDVKLPGLNDVLERYQATHGPNKLKEVMKGRFGVVPREYFLQRPIDKEFLIYSARDVEDLVEIKEKMEQKLEEVLLFFINSNSPEKQRFDLLCKKISKSYSLHGCVHKDINI